MFNFNNLFLKSMLLILTVIPVSAGAISYFSANHAQWINIKSVIELDMARNESELLLFKVGNKQNKMLSINLTPLDGSRIDYQTFEVMQANQGEGKIDAIKPLDNNSTASTLLLKIKIPTGVMPGQYNRKLTINNGNSTIYSGTLKINVHNVLLGKPDIALQGNLLFKRKGIPEEIILRVMNLIKVYGFDSIILPKKFITDRSLENRVLSHALKEFKNVRLPPRKLFTRKKTMSELLAKRHIHKQQWVQEECAYIKKLQAGLQGKKYVHNQFVYKLWDEPASKNYAEVAYGYRALNNCVNGISFEISEQPSPKLGDIADIWTVHINRLNENTVRQLKNQRDEIYLYANYLHEIGSNPQNIKNIGWLLGYFDMDGYHFWSVANWQNGFLEQAQNRTGREDRGVLFYWDKRTNKILPSLRIEMFSEGLDDMQLLKRVRRCSISGSNNGKHRAANILGRVGSSINSWAYSGKQRGRTPNFSVFKKELLMTLVSCGT